MYNERYNLHKSTGYLLGMTSRTIRKLFNRELLKRGYRITGEHFDVLFYLMEKDGQHQQQLAETLCKDKTTITRIINRVEALNLVKRKTNRTDGRQKKVCLTGTGRKIVREAMSLSREIMIKVQKNISQADMAVFNKVLSQFHDVLIQEMP